MGKFFKITATALFVALAFAVFAEAYACPDTKGGHDEAPVECCLHCCPRHHLAPPTVLQATSSREPMVKNFLVREFSPHSILLADSIFHPPRA